MGLSFNKHFYGGKIFILYLCSQQFEVLQRFLILYGLVTNSLDNELEVKREILWTRRDV
jgi:hypothetical protein